VEQWKSPYFLLEIEKLDARPIGLARGKRHRSPFGDLAVVRSVVIWVFDNICFEIREAKN